MNRILWFLKVKKKREEIVTIRVPLTGPRKKNSNFIRTSKYTVWTFLPLNLFRQITRIPIIFFIIIVIMKMFPGISKIGGFGSMLPPLFIITVSCFKDFVDDSSRWKADRKSNSRKVRVLNVQRFRYRHRKKINPEREEYWSNTMVPKSDLNPGDVIELSKDEEVPVDLIISQSSNSSGNVFVETSNLDGETNLKLRESLFKRKYIEPETTRSSDSSSSEEFLYREPENTFDLQSQDAIIKVNQNTEKLDQFGGTFKLLEKESVNEEKIMMTRQNFICSGSVIRNTEKIQGIVIFTGKNSKICKNFKNKRTKTGKFEKNLTWLVIVLIFVQEVMILFCLVVSLLFEVPRSSGIFEIMHAVFGDRFMIRNHWYVLPLLEIEYDESWFYIVFRKWMILFILFQYMLPMAVFVSLEVSLTLQSRIMSRRIKHGNVKMKANSSSLNPDLAKVDVIITDKTGTLTDNIMKFEGCCTIDEDSQEFVRYWYVEENDFKNLPNLFTLGVLTNNSVLPMGPSQFEGESVDEVTLCNDLLSRSSLRLIDRTTKMVVVERIGEDGTPSRFEIPVLQVIGFTSERKRMTTICVIEELVHVFVKGADSVIFSLSKNSDDDDEITRKSQFINSVEQYSKEGLRTLVFGHKCTNQTVEEFKMNWLDEYTNLVHNEKEGNRLDELVHEIESGIEVIGVTAISDEIQEGVRDCVSFFKEAGLRFYVLTGDKIETTIQTCIRCGIIEENSNVSVIKYETNEERVVGDPELDNIIERKKSRIEEDILRISKNQDLQNVLVVDGQSVEIIIKEQKKQFVKILRTVCDSLVCCRVNPLQKTEISKFVRKYLRNKRCLCIGDGANDVSMIQNSEIGVGIMGRAEGSNNQASRASDFAIPRFKYLKNLLAVEGRYCYYRISLILVLILLKNFPIPFIRFLYFFHNGFSASILMDPWIKELWNLFFTSLVVFYIGIFDKDLRSDILLQSPHHYKSLKYCYFVGRSVSLDFCSRCCCCVRSSMPFETIGISILMFAFLILFTTGDSGKEILGFFFSTTFLIFFYFQAVCVRTRTHSILFWITILYGVIWYISFCFCYGWVEKSPFFFTPFVAFGSISFVLLLILIIGCFCMPYLAFKYMKVKYFPSMVDKELYRRKRRMIIFDRCCELMGS